ncbi:MAG TPA: hypothetical protein VFC01_06295 [Mycobacterium sp.]|nr:hypothetical protein [Mycobacterium sp.]
MTVSTSATITALMGGVSRTATLTVNPAPPPAPSAPSLLSPANQATVSQPITFDWTDAANATTYNIQIDNSSNFTTPLTLSQTVGVSQATITGLPAQQLWWRVRGINSAGVAGPFSPSRRFTAQTAPATASLSALSVSPSSVVGGAAAQGTVTLTSGAPSGGAVVSLSSSSGSASVPASVTVAAGATTASFTVSTSTVAASTSATLTATYNTVSRTATLTVTPPPPAASLSALSVSPTSVTGGNTAQGTVTLTSGAPSGGAVVSLSSSSNSASVPASVLVAAGATTVSFTVSTSTVAASTSATLTATYNTVSRTVVLTVTPVPTGPLPAPTLSSPAADARFLPGQNIVFDWSDVTGATSYTIQIDDQDTFPAPQIVSQTVTPSTYSNSTLPTRQMWWRVRANDSAGNPGTWSSVRRVEVKN